MRRLVISPRSVSRMNIDGTASASLNTSNCRFVESSPNTIIFQGKQGYEGPYSPYGIPQFFKPNEPFTASYTGDRYENGRRILSFGGPGHGHRDSIIDGTVLFPALRVGEYENIDLSLNGIDLSGARTSPNYSISFCNNISEFTVDEFPIDPTSSTVLTGTTGSSASTRYAIMEECHIGTGEFIGNYIDSFCKARFGLYLPWTTEMPLYVSWEYNEYYKTWAGPFTPTPGDPNENRYHYYIDWYFG